MFSRASVLICRNVGAGCGPSLQQERGMATLKLIKMRLRSIKNIQKITRSMKMVSAAKYARAERELKPVRPFGHGTVAFYEKIEPKGDPTKPKHLLVAMSSDRGLCGGVHSNICRFIKAEIAASEHPEDIAIVCVGDKSRLQLSRMHGKNIIFQVNEVGRKPSTFEDAALIATQILNSGYEFGSGKIIFNRFKSVVAYKTTPMPFFPTNSIMEAEKMSIYDSIDADVLQSYLEYSLASMIFYASKEGACSEQSARMTAMDSATKNAGEMIDKLSLIYNRTRQSVITGELIEIISGAAALT